MPSWCIPTSSGGRIVQWLTALAADAKVPGSVSGGASHRESVCTVLRSPTSTEVVLPRRMLILCRGKAAPNLGSLARLSKCWNQNSLLGIYYLDNASR